MAKQYMVPMFALVAAENESATEGAVAALQNAALKHGFSLFQDELLQPKPFDDETDEIHSVLDLVPKTELNSPCQVAAAGEGRVKALENALEAMWAFASGLVEKHGNTEGDDSLTDEEHAAWQDAAGEANNLLGSARQAYGFGAIYNTERPRG